MRNGMRRCNGSEMRLRHVTTCDVAWGGRYSPKCGYPLPRAVLIGLCVGGGAGGGGTSENVAGQGVPAKVGTVSPDRRRFLPRPALANFPCDSPATRMWTAAAFLTPSGEKLFVLETRPHPSQQVAFASHLSPPANKVKTQQAQKCVTTLATWSRTRKRNRVAW